VLGAVIGQQPNSLGWPGDRVAHSARACRTTSVGTVPTLRGTCGAVRPPPCARRRWAEGSGAATVLTGLTTAMHERGRRIGPSHPARAGV
jgi:hypothetical protein